MGYLLGAIVGALCLVLMIRLVLEWRRFARGGHIISGRQMALRVASAVLLLGLLAMVAAGARIQFESAETALAYWGGALVLALLAMMLAIADIGILRRRYADRRAESYRRLSSYIRSVERRRDSGAGPP